MRSVNVSNRLLEWQNKRLERLIVSPLFTFSRFECIARDRVVPCEHFWRLPALVMPHAEPFVVSHRGRRTIVDPNSYVFVNASETYRATHIFGGSHNGSFIVLQPTVLRDLMAEFDPSVEERPLQPFAALTASRSAAAYAAECLLSKLAESTARDDVLSLEELAFDLARQAFASLSHDSPASPADRERSNERELCEEVKEILARSLYQPLSLARIATELGLSASYLERIFRRVTGTAIGRYRKQLRLREALCRVLDGDGDLAAVALGLGFSSHSHFTAAFRREFGFTPVALRRLASVRLVRALLCA